MPQVWLSYDEIGRWLGHCGSGTANYVVTQGWKRRRCSDGLIRSKLPAEIVNEYLLHYLGAAAPEQAADLQVSALRALLHTSDERTARRLSTRRAS